MNVLFLYPHPAEDRLTMYRRAARDLHEKFGHRVVFVYIGQSIAFDDDLPTEHFDRWVADNQVLIDRTTLLELEARFRDSNLWRCLVSQRTFADYSYIGGGFARGRYPLADLERYLKAVVLFYESVIRRYGIDVAMAHAPDVIHSQALYELSLSLPFRAINQYYDPYWKRDGRYCVDKVTFSSSWLTRRYQELFADYDRAVRPREQELERALDECLASDPRKVIAAQGWPTGLTAAVRTAAIALWRHRRNFSLAPRSVADAYVRHSVLLKGRAWLVRLRNLIERRVRVRWSHELPSRPFVFVALHYQPEAATLACAPVWSDMLAMVRMLSASLPAGFQLAVKDHPIIGGLRRAAFYRAINDLPNTVLLPETYPTTPLLERAALVCTLAGTVGLQALMRGKLVLLFGHIYYDCIEGIMRPPADLNDLPMLLKDVLINGKLPSAELRKKGMLAFMAAYQQVIVTNEKMEHGRTAEQRGEGLAELIDLWMRHDLTNTAVGAGAA